MDLSDSVSILHGGYESNERHAISQGMVALEHNCRLCLSEVFNSDDFEEETFLIEWYRVLMSQKIDKGLFGGKCFTFVVVSCLYKSVFRCINKLVETVFFEIVLV